VTKNTDVNERAIEIEDEMESVIYCDYLAVPETPTGLRTVADRLDAAEAAGVEIAVSTDPHDNILGWRLMTDDRAVAARLTFPWFCQGYADWHYSMLIGAEEPDYSLDETTDAAAAFGEHDSEDDS
jgi:hypothetical protein